MKRLLDLRTGKPVWQSYRAPTVASQRLTRNLRTDVLVVGAGISGAMISEMLSAQGLSVAMIDRRGAMKGSTAATTALIQNELDVPLTDLIKKIGRADAQAAWRRSRLAVANLKARIEQLQIKCDFVERSSLLLAGDVLDANGLQKEAELRRETGIYADYLSRTQLINKFGISSDGAILNPDNIALNPRKLTAGFLNAAIQRGMKIFSPVEAISFTHASGIVTVGTSEGFVIEAGHVVLATGYELASVVPARGHSIVSTWALATKRQPRNLWPCQSFVWEASDPYLYLRTSSDGRVICGGEDEEFENEDARDALIEPKIKTIAFKLKKLFPQLDVDPEFAWAGSFGTTPTGLPIIGAVQRRPRIHAIMGYGGNGITFSRIAAELVTSAILGKKDCDASIFSPKAEAS